MGNVSLHNALGQLASDDPTLRILTLLAASANPLWYFSIDGDDIVVTRDYDDVLLAYVAIRPHRRGFVVTNAVLTSRVTHAWAGVDIDNLLKKKMDWDYLPTILTGVWRKRSMFYET